jgi:hypothetical protein
MWSFYNSSGQKLSTAATSIDVLDIDGATDIGAAIVDADLFIVDDGAGGTNRKTAASRLVTYVGANTDTRSGVAKGWAYVTVSGGSPTLAANFNVAGIVDSDVGRYDITWDTDFASANYSVAGMGGSSRRMSFRDVHVAGTTYVITMSTDGTAFDVANWAVVAHGVLAT